MNSFSRTDPTYVCMRVRMCVCGSRIVCKYVEGSLPRAKNGRYFADDGFIRGSLTRLLVSTFVFTFFVRPFIDTSFYSPFIVPI